MRAVVQVVQISEDPFYEHGLQVMALRNVLSSNPGIFLGRGDDVA